MYAELYKCPECGSENIHNDDKRFEKTCEACGLVLGERIPTLLYGGFRHPDRHHMGGPRNLEHWDKKLTTVIPSKNVDWREYQIPAKIRSTMDRLRKRQRLAMTDKDRRLSVALSMLKSFSVLLDITESVINEAVVILRKFLKVNNLRGRNYETFIAAVLYTSCKIKRSPRNIEEISIITSTKKKNISRDYVFLIKTLRIKIPWLKLSEYIPRVAALSGVPMKVKIRALEILNNAKRIAGKTPWGLAGAAIYLAAKEYGYNITQKDSAEASFTAEATIRNRFKELKNLLSLDH